MGNSAPMEGCQVKKLIAGLVLSGALLVGCSVSSTSSTMKFKKHKLDAVIAASQAAAHCGGYLLIDTDDGEALVGGCDR